MTLDINDADLFSFLMRAPIKIVTISIITYFWLFSLIIDKKLNWVATQLPLNEKENEIILTLKHMIVLKVV